MRWVTLSFSFALPRCHVCEHVGEAIIRRQLANGTAFEDNAIVRVYQQIQGRLQREEAASEAT